MTRSIAVRMTTSPSIGLRGRMLIWSMFGVMVSAGMVASAYSQQPNFVAGESGKWSLVLTHPWIGGSPKQWADLAFKAKQQSLASAPLFEEVAELSKRYDAIFVDMHTTSEVGIVYASYDNRPLGFTLPQMQEILVTAPNPKNYFEPHIGELRSCISKAVGNAPAGGIPSVLVQYECVDYGAKIWVCAIQFIATPDRNLQLTFVGKSAPVVNSLRIFQSMLSSLRFSQ